MPVKKTAAVVAPKKAAPKAVKKSAAKTSTPSLIYASDAHSFWTQSGDILNSLVSLRDALGTMSKETFSHHVKAGKHDFATWVDAVLQDAACAADLRKTKTASTAKAVVVRHLKRYGV
jgi:hypothetical protein